MPRTSRGGACLAPRTDCARSFGVFSSLGSVLDAILHIINYTFIRELPMEFFYLIAMYKYLGGTPIFYLGVYAYAIEISKENRKII